MTVNVGYVSAKAAESAAFLKDVSDKEFDFVVDSFNGKSLVSKNLDITKTDLESAGSIADNILSDVEFPTTKFQLYTRINNYSSIIDVDNRKGNALKDIKDYIEDDLRSVRI